MNLITPEYRQWGKTVKKALIDEELSITELARRLEIPRQYINFALNGKRIDEDVVSRVSEYLEINTP